MRPLLALLLLGCGTNVIAVDAGPGAPMSVDVSGTWHDCDASLTYAPGGIASSVEHRTGCVSSGTWRMIGPDLVETIWTTSSCGGEEVLSVLRAFLGEGGITLVDPDTAAVRRLADDATPHALWLLEGSDGSETRSTTASVVGNPEEAFGSGCYWSTDDECGGLFSCGGSVRVWELEGSRFSASTSCTGGCPCGAVLEGTMEADGTLRADYRGVNCERSFEGTLTARRLDP